MPKDWQNSFQTLRNEFARAAEQRGHLRHRIALAWAEDGPPLHEFEQQHIAKPPRWNEWNEDNPADFSFITTPLTSRMRGNDGKATAEFHLTADDLRQQGLNPYLDYTSCKEWAYVECYEEYFGGKDEFGVFELLARDAGRCLMHCGDKRVQRALAADLPLPPQFILRGRFLGEERLRWILAIYHLAWRGERGSLLFAGKRTYLPSGSGKFFRVLPFENRAIEAAMHDNEHAGAERPCLYFSALEQGLFRASVFAVDVLLDYARTGEDSKASSEPRPAGADGKTAGGVAAPLHEGADVHASGGKTAGGRKAPAVPPATVSDDAKMSVAELSKAFGVPAEPLRKRLERLRRRDFTCFAEVPEPARKQPTFLYHVGKVRPVIEALKASVKASAKASAKRPT